MYDHKQVETKWQEKWDAEIASGKSNWLFDEKRGLKGDKKYLLDMFPYPSGAGLHVGHVEEKVALDIYARYLRMRGENVLMPTGWDAFGLPTENFAIKNNLTPELATKQNTNTFKVQSKRLGISYDWPRELATSDPEYYKFTQWWFKFLYERGLAYRKTQSVNWCPKDNTVLANEQVIDGKCERCDTEVVQKEMEQWFFRITDYADRLLIDLEKLGWPESTKAGQRNWLGKSEGTLITFLVPKYQKVVFSTTNKAKIARVQKLVKYLKLPIEIIDPKQAGLKEVDVEETSGDLVENATLKAKAYADQTDLPVLAIDTGFFIEGENIDPVKVKRNALGDLDESKLSQEEIADLMQKYYQKIATKKGGEVAAEFRDGIVLVDSKEKVYSELSRRELILTDKVVGELDPYFPIRSLYKVKVTGKYTAEQSIEEEYKELQPVWLALRRLLAYDLEVYSTRVDTIFGATYLVLAPEHQLVENLSTGKFKNEVQMYRKLAAEKTELQRSSLEKEKSGVVTGSSAVNPFTGELMPIWVADYVLNTYGTGAIMAVPAHDQRDFEFAQKYHLPILNVIKPNEKFSKLQNKTDKNEIYSDYGILENSGDYNGLTSEQTKCKFTKVLETLQQGKSQVNFKMRDWSISRQRYWGSPIPMVYKKLSKAEEELAKLYRNEPEFVLNLHAWQSSPENHFHPWISNKLTEMNVRNSSPVMPMDGIIADSDRWLEVVTDVIPSEVNLKNTVITGRSLGAWTALRFAEKNLIRKLVLVAPANPYQYKYPERLAKVLKSDSPEYKVLEKFVGGPDGKLDWEKVTANVGEIVVFLSTDDPYIDPDHTEQFFRERLPFARIIRVRNANHFTADAGFTTFPTLLTELIAPVRLDILPVLDKDLPVVLPEDVDYRPKGTAPLGTSKEFNKSLDKNVYGNSAEREIDTMDTFVCSSWYYFRFLDPRNNEVFADQEKMQKFGPVDFYIGGAEHTVLHLLYSRFFTKVAYDAGLIDYDEPFLTLRHQGLIMGPDNRKMSKRWGNVINPNDIVDEYGADTLRMYEMFMGPLDQMKAWNIGGVRGVRRFLQRIWDDNQLIIKKDVKESSPKLASTLSKLLDKVASDIEQLKFNTGVSEFMKYANLLEEEQYKLTKEDWLKFLIALNPFAPFLTSELWTGFNKTSLAEQSWPTLEIKKSEEVEMVELVVMINGKLRDKLQVSKGTQKSTVVAEALKLDRIQKYVTSPSQIKKDVFVQDKLLNIVI